MNEMNNQGNEFNNQKLNYENEKLNYENNNYGENNYNQFNQEQGNNINYQNNNQKEEKSKKSYCGLLVVFMVISLLLTGYIVYDKVIKKEEPAPGNDNPPSILESTCISTKSDNCYDYKLNGKNHMITLKYNYSLVDGFCGEEGKYHYVKINSLLDGKAILNNQLDDIYLSETEDYKSNGLYTNFDVKQYVKTIKSDKEYLVFIAKGDNSCTGADTVLYIVDENGTVLKNVTLWGDQSVELEDSNRKSVYYDASKNEYRSYLIDADSVYYLGEVGADADKVIEYKLIVNNGEVIETENATYNVIVSGAIR